MSFPKSENGFEVAKNAILNQIESQRITKASILFNYETARKKGIDYDIRKDIERQFLQMALKVKLNIKEVRSPALSAQIVSQTIASELERRIPFRRVMKQTIERVMKAGAKGVKICLGGRLNGVEIARTEKMATGIVPLLTLRSDIDYAFNEAQTIYGKIGIKVWVCHGKVFGRKDKFADTEVAEAKKEEPRKIR